MNIILRCERRVGDANIDVEAYVVNGVVREPTVRLYHKMTGTCYTKFTEEAWTDLKDTVDDMLKTVNAELERITP